MLEGREFLLRAQLSTATLEAWIEAGWLVPRTRPGRSTDFPARSCPRLADPRPARGMGVNDEGVAVVLGLLDQVHGLRHALRRVSAVLHSVPEPLRRTSCTIAGRRPR